MASFNIGELGKRSNLPPKTIRYYESVGLLPKALRAPNGYRLYSDADVGRLDFIRKAKRLGLTLEEILPLMPLLDSSDCDSVHAKLLVNVEERLALIDKEISGLEEMRSILLRLLQRPARGVSRSSRAAGTCGCADCR
ncbi:MAG: MerR family transcriptional regulator [Actinobacteria bacterium]|nr:MAG: MerR family transcriptional regulator [Actinomycetota bacterium]